MVPKCKQYYVAFEKYKAIVNLTFKTLGKLANISRGHDSKHWYKNVGIYYLKKILAVKFYSFSYICTDNKLNHPKI